MINPFSDFDACATNECDDNHTVACKDQVAEYNCICEPGYGGDKCDYGEFRVYTLFEAPLDMALSLCLSYGICTKIFISFYRLYACTG